MDDANFCKTCKAEIFGDPREGWWLKFESLDTEFYFCCRPCWEEWYILNDKNVFS